MYDVYEGYDADVHRRADYCIGSRVLSSASTCRFEGDFDHWLQSASSELWSAGCDHVHIDVDLEHSCRRHDVPYHAGRARGIGIGKIVISTNPKNLY